LLPETVTTEQPCEEVAGGQSVRGCDRVRCKGERLVEPPPLLGAAGKTATGFRDVMPGVKDMLPADGQATVGIMRLASAAAPPVRGVELQAIALGVMLPPRLARLPETARLPGLMRLAALATWGCALAPARILPLMMLAALAR